MGWLSSWQYRKSHEIQGSSAGAQTNYQVKIVVHKGSGTDSGEHVYCNNHCRDDFGDIRFTKDDGTTELYYWLEEYTSGDKATFWVKIPSIPASPDKATIYIYYGKSDATTTSNGDDTFLLFDHFEGTSLNSDKWEGITGDVTVSDSVVKLRDLNTGTLARFYSKNSWQYNVAFRCRARFLYINHYSGFGFSTPTSPYDRVYFNLHSSNTLKSETSNEDTNTLTVLGSPSTSWKIYEATWTSNEAKFYIDETLKATHTTNMPDEALRFREAVLRAKAGNNAGQETDWVLIREYVDPEPSHGSWGNEEQSGATEVAITDSAAGIEALSRPYRGLNFTDTTTGQESFSRPYRQLQIPEQASSLELLLKTRNLNLGDIAASLEIIERARQIGAITDTAQSLEQILKQRFISLIDAAAGGEIIARPTRMTILADEALSQEILSKLRELTAVTDSAIGIEYVNVGAEGAIKTRIFLLIGDLAIQITGD